MGALAASGGDGGVRSREGERAEEDRVGGRSGCGAREVRGISKGVGEAASRRWPGRVCAHGGHTPILQAKEEDDRGGARWAGPATLATR